MPSYSIPQTAKERANMALELSLLKITRLNMRKYGGGDEKKKRNNSDLSP